jgi:long-subunit acyl-CoA synthetase (AMP-forming)
MGPCLRPAPLGHSTNLGERPARPPAARGRSFSAGAPAVLEEVAAGIARANQSFSGVEQIKTWKLLETDWEAGGDVLTPTMKLERKRIAAKYAEEIETLQDA